MKYYVLMAVLLLCTGVVNSTDRVDSQYATKLDDMAKQVPDQLYAGDWQTSAERPFAVITASALSRQKVFLIKSVKLVDADSIVFDILVDGKKQRHSLPEGGSVFVEGKSLVIEQVTPGVNALGTWQVVQTAPVHTATTNWLIDPNSGVNKAVLASFRKSQVFSVSFNRNPPGCLLGEFILYVDNKPVLDPRGDKAVFLNGSTVAGSGKYIHVERASGTCNSSNDFYGSLKIAANR